MAEASSILTGHHAKWLPVFYKPYVTDQGLVQDAVNGLTVVISPVWEALDLAAVCLYDFGHMAFLCSGFESTKVLLTYINSLKLHESPICLTTPFVVNKEIPYITGESKSR